LRVEKRCNRAPLAGRITTHWNGPAGRNGPPLSKDGRAPGRPFNADPLACGWRRSQKT
jgi:hypothetical protein